MIRLVPRLFLMALLASPVGSTTWSKPIPEAGTTSASPTEDPQWFEVILPQERPDAVWPELVRPNPPPSPAPPLNFDSDRVLVYAVGTQPSECYSAEINALSAQGEAVLVEVIEKEPAPNCVCTFSLVEFFHVIRLDSKVRTGYPLRSPASEQLLILKALASAGVRGPNSLRSGRASTSPWERPDVVIAVLIRVSVVGLS